MPGLRQRLPAVLVPLLLLGGLAGCSKADAVLQPKASVQGATIGDVDAGRKAIEKVGCGACHAIPGIAGAVGMVGPSLDHIASHEYLAGMLHNTPDGMITWLRHPQRIVPGNAMPDMGLSAADARNIAAYLFTLK
jgi:cytochrome c2